MSLSAWEQQALESIKDGLADSDPAMIARLTMFARLASGEEMPAREKIQAGSRPAVRRSGPQPRHPRAGEVLRPAPRVYQRLGLQGAMMLLWLVTSVALIAVALAYNRGDSHGTCTGSWAAFCANKTSASNSAPGIP